MQYNTTTNDPSSADWSTLYNISHADISSNSWTLISATVPAAAKFYNGVYLRFRQNSHGTDTTYYTWAVTSITFDLDGTPGSSGGSSGGSSTSLALLDLSSSNNFDLPTPQPGTRLTTVGSVTGMTSRTEVPSNTPIIVFDSNGYYNPVRTVTIKNKVFLTSVSLYISM